MSGTTLLFKLLHYFKFNTSDEISRSSFKHRTALYWNLLPDSFNNSSSLGSFKRLIRENKDFLKTISFENASCSLYFKSMDFKDFWIYNA